jgi:hypothetical protein
MACACKTVQQIGYLQKKYGDKTPQNKKTNIGETVGLNVKRLLFYLVVVLFFPVFTVYALVKLIGGKDIRLDKLIKRKRNV